HIKDAKGYVEWKFSEAETCLDWILSVQCSQLSSAAASELCATILKGIDAAEVVTQRQLLHDVHALLDAVLVEHSPLEMNLLDAPWVFCSVLKQIVSVPGVDVVPWDKLPTNIFADVLDRIIREPSLCRQSIPLIGILSLLSACNNAALSSIFLKPLESRLQLLVQWITASEVGLETFLQLRPLLEYLSASRESALTDLLSGGMLETLLSTSVYLQLADNCPLFVRCSDRWNYAALSARRPPAKEGQPSRSSDENDLFGETLSALISIFGPRIHEKLVSKCIQLFAHVVSNIHEADHRILEGSARHSPNVLAHSFLMLYDVLEYIGALSRALTPFTVSTKDADEPSFSVLPENFAKVKQINFVTFECIVQKPSNASKAQVTLPLCTYSATEKQFILQHWYNCHTCGIVNGEGTYFVNVVGGQIGGGERSRLSL
ncbi:unnamed protein product, partial [Toxocara canis]|uniref:Ubiquitinyl hydrolase 1 n=1 Tax=Toxocara canis TaxID=6265 RepID=A0A183V583_TOXCA